MPLTTKQFQNLTQEAGRIATDLPVHQMFPALVAAYEAGKLLGLPQADLVALLGGMALHCIAARVDADAPAAQPTAGTWPRIIAAAHYDDEGNLVISGQDDDRQAWKETITGRSQEAWLLKQLYVERKYGRRWQSYARRRGA